MDGIQLLVVPLSGTCFGLVVVWRLYDLAEDAYIRQGGITVTQLLSRSEAAAMLRVSTRTLDRRCREGKIAYIADRPGARVMFRVADLETYLTKHRKASRSG